MKYKKQDKRQQNINVIGMLHIVDVRMVKKNTREKIKHKLLMIGCEASDIERKLRWIFEADKYEEFSIKSIEKVREKVHTLSTVVTQDKQEAQAIIQRKENSSDIHSATTEQEVYSPNLYAIGVVTTILAADDKHALRKLGRSLIGMANEVKSNEAPRLSDDSIINIEQVPKSSGYATPRDTTNEVNRAHIVRG